MRNDADYNKYAKAIVADFRKDQAAGMHDSLVKLASDTGLNPNETRRLVEKTNMTAHLSFFDKTSQDNYIEFDVIDPEAVIGELFGKVTPSGPVQEKVAMYDYDSLMRSTRPRDMSKLASWGAEDVTDVLQEEREARVERSKSASERRQVASLRSELVSRLGQEELRYAEKVSHIVQCTAGMYAHDVRDVVEDALCLHGEAAYELVTDLVKIAKVDLEAEIDPEKFVGERSWHHDIKTALDIRHQCAILSTAIAELPTT